MKLLSCDTWCRYIITIHKFGRISRQYSKGTGKHPKHNLIVYPVGTIVYLILFSEQHSGSTPYFCNLAQAYTFRA